MQIMHFEVTEQHVRRDRFKTVLWIVLACVASVAILVGFLNGGKSSPGLMVVVGGVFLLYSVFPAVKKLKEGKASFPALDLDLAKQQLTVSVKDVSINVDLSQINSLRLQRKAGVLVSILLNSPGAGDMRFEGYENMEQLAQLLEQLTPSNKVTQAGFFHC